MPDKIEFYEDRQVEHILPFCPVKVDWFVIGGPADGNEAQVFKEYYPHCQVLGFEPNPWMRDFQARNKFPGTMIPRALYSDNKLREFVIPGNDRCGSLVKYPTLEEGFTKRRVPCSTLRSVATQYASFDNVVLWIDIEGSELECLKGADGLLIAKAIKVINVEVTNDNKLDITEYLKSFGYSWVDDWNTRHMSEDRIISDLVFKHE